MAKNCTSKMACEKTAREIALSQVSYMQQLIDHGFNILAIIGMEFSRRVPSVC